jgi:3-methyladenine DNA glycosylase AlkD
VIDDRWTGRFTADVLTRLAAAAEPDRAAGMQAYMKSEQPYRGVRLPLVRAAVRAAVNADPAPSPPDGAEAATTLWRTGQYREDRYAVLELLALPPLRGRVDLLPLLREIIVTGAWWDYVDATSHLVGEVLRTDQAAVRPQLLAWSQEPDRWLRRSSIICQLGFKSGTDLDLLATTILASVDDGDFFLHKGIGWALRDYARTDPDWVLAFVEQHQDRLSPLSRREAVKRLAI